MVDRALGRLDLAPARSCSPRSRARCSCHPRPGDARNRDQPLLPVSTAPRASTTCSSTRAHTGKPHGQRSRVAHGAHLGLPRGRPRATSRSTSRSPICSRSTDRPLAPAGQPYHSTSLRTLGQLRARLSRGRGVRRRRVRPPVARTGARSGRSPIRRTSPTSATPGRARTPARCGSRSTRLHHFAGAVSSPSSAAATTPGPGAGPGAPLHRRHRDRPDP